MLSWGSESSPSPPGDHDRAGLPARRRDRRHATTPTSPSSPTRSAGLGPPLLPPLQLGDERQLVPLVGEASTATTRANTSPPGATSMTSSPPSARPTPPGSGARTPTRTSAGSGTSRRSTRGIDYVDWTCMDGYNWGKTPVNPHPWKTFTEIFDPTYKLLTTKVAPKKPILSVRSPPVPTGATRRPGSATCWPNCRSTTPGSAASSSSMASIVGSNGRSRARRARRAPSHPASAGGSSKATGTGRSSTSPIPPPR